MAGGPRAVSSASVGPKPGRRPWAASCARTLRRRLRRERGKPDHDVIYRYIVVPVKAEAVADNSEVWKYEPGEAAACIFAATGDTGPHTQVEEKVAPAPQQIFLEDLVDIPQMQPLEKVADDKQAASPLPKLHPPGIHVECQTSPMDANALSEVCGTSKVESCIQAILEAEKKHASIFEMVRHQESLTQAFADLSPEALAEYTELSSHAWVTSATCRSALTAAMTEATSALPGKRDHVEASIQSILEAEKASGSSLFGLARLQQALKQAFLDLDPRALSHYTDLSSKEWISSAICRRALGNALQVATSASDG